MLPSRHIAVSVLLGAGLWFFTRSVCAAFLCIFTGVMPDVDHLIDYIVQHGWSNNLIRQCYVACKHTNDGEGEYKFRKLYLFFHSNEIALILWILAIFTGNVCFFGVALGYASHLLLDMIDSRRGPVFYFIIWRFIKNFDTDILWKRNKL